MNTHDGMRAALRKHGITDDELVEAVAAKGVPPDDVMPLVDRFVAGGPCSFIVAEAILEVIVSQAAQTRH